MLTLFLFYKIIRKTCIEYEWHQNIINLPSLSQELLQHSTTTSLCKLSYPNGNKVNLHIHLTGIFNAMAISALFTRTWLFFTPLPGQLNPTWATTCNLYDDVIKWKHFLRYWPFVRGIHRSPVNSPQRPVTRSFGVFFDLRQNKRLSTQSRRELFETPLRPLWHHCNGIQFPCDWLSHRGWLYTDWLNSWVALYVSSGGGPSQGARHLTTRPRGTWHRTNKAGCFICA